MKNLVKKNCKIIGGIRKGLQTLIMFVIFCCFLLMSGNNQAMAQTGNLDNGFTYSYDQTSKTLTITGTGELPEIDTSIKNACLGVKHIVVSEGVTACTSGLSYFSSAEDIMLPSTITKVKGFSFFGDDSLTELRIPAAVNEIESTAFWGTDNLEKVTVDNNNEKYKDINGVLYTKDGTVLCKYPNKYKGASYTIPEGVKEIEDYAVEDNTDLSQVTLPSTLERIGVDAFGGCTSIKDITLPVTVKTVDDCAFAKTAIPQVTIPAGVTSIGDNLFGNDEQFTAYNVEEGNTSYCSIDGVLYEIGDEYNLVDYPYGKKDKTLIIPDGVKNILSINSLYLESIWLPDDLDGIRNSAFYCAQLKSIIVPQVKVWSDPSFTLSKKLECVGIVGDNSCCNRSMFQGDYLTKVYAKRGNAQLQIAKDAGKDYGEIEAYGTCGDHIRWFVAGDTLVCSGVGDMENYLNTSTPWETYKDQIHNVYVYSEITSIGEYAFTSMPSLEGVYLDKSITDINTHAFDDSTSAVFYVTPESAAANYANSKGYATQPFYDIDERDGLKGENITNEDYHLSSDSDNLSAEDELEQIYYDIDPNWSDYQKVLWTYTYLCSNFDYDYDYKNYYVYDFLEDKKGVCNAYATTFAEIMKELEIPCIVAISDDMNHGWNIVKVDGNWYHVDATWGSSGGRKFGDVDYDYFMVSDERIKELRHYGWSNYVLGTVSPDNQIITPDYDDIITCSDDTYQNGPLLGAVGLESINNISTENGNWYYSAEGKMYQYDFDTKNSTVVFDSKAEEYIGPMFYSYDYIYYLNKGNSNSFYEIHEYNVLAKQDRVVFHLSRFSKQFIQGLRVKKGKVYFCIGESGGKGDNPEYELENYSPDSYYQKTAGILALRQLGNGDYVISGLAIDEGISCVLDIGRQLAGSKGINIVGIENGAFKNNQNILGIIVPDCITRIGSSAFAGCSNLMDVTYENNHKVSIGMGAFSDTLYEYGVTMDDIRIVTFDVNGGDELTPNMYTYYYNMVYGTLPTPTRKGYIFDGWYNDDNVRITENMLCYFNENICFHAHWTAEHTIVKSITLGNYKQTHSGAILLYQSDGQEIEDDNTFMGTGMTLFIDDQPYIVKLVGDTDGNGYLNVIDMEKIQKHILGIQKLQDVYLDAALTDENSYNNHMPTVLDMERIQKVILNIN